jgi:hypothetical protein
MERPILRYRYLCPMHGVRRIFKASLRAWYVPLWLRDDDDVCLLVGGELRVFKTDTGTSHGVVAVDTSKEPGITCIAVSKDGEELYYASGDQAYVVHN